MSDKPRCGAKAKSGRPCVLPAGWGTDHVGYGSCRFHFGSTRNGRTSAARQQATAEAARLGVAIETDPHEALATIVAILAGQVAFLQRKVAEIEEGQELDADSLHPTVRALNSVIEQWQRASKAAADAGVAKRRADLNELAVTGAVDAMRRTLAGVDFLTAEQETEILTRLATNLRALPVIEDWRDRPELEP